MPLINGPGLAAVVADLTGRNALLWHACQLKDFRSYLKIGGVPSRAKLERSGLPFTRFGTDARDVENGVWDKVFFNFADFGNCFANGRNCSPNAFGPIIMAIHPRVMLGATDVSITLRSASGLAYDRTAEGVAAADVGKLFQDKKRYLRSSEEIAAAFNVEAHCPEMNCSFEAGFAPLADIAYLVVDPYREGDMSLTDAVKNLLGGPEWNNRIKLRLCNNGRTATDYQYLWEAISAGARTIPEVRASLPGHSTLLPWLGEAEVSETTPFQFERYTRYLADGTISVMSDHHPREAETPGSDLQALVSQILEHPDFVGRLSEQLEGMIHGKNGMMETRDGTLEGSISAASFDGFKFTDFTADDESASGGFACATVAHYDGVTWEGEDVTNERHGRTRGLVAFGIHDPQRDIEEIIEGLEFEITIEERP